MTPVFFNPVLWEDLPDPEVLRVGDEYFMSASSFHFSPGAPVLKSRDLVNWKYIGHSVPELPPAARFKLDDRQIPAYGKGIWASTLKFRQSNKLFYFYSAVQGTDKTYVYTSKSPSDIWTVHPPIERFYYDAGLLIDEDDEMYIAHGAKTIQVSQLSSDGLKEVTSRIVHESQDHLEGCRMYKINGLYYIWLTKGPDAQYVLKSTAGPFGPYEVRNVIKEMRCPMEGSGPPHQGGLVDTPDGKWYYMAFTDAFPCGRVPLLAPIVFDDDGWPAVVAGNTDMKGNWLAEYPYPLTENKTNINRKMGFRRYEFKQQQLEPCWEWNHNPDNTRWFHQDGQLILTTATVTKSLHLAANTLTLRTVGPGSKATFCIDTSEMKDGDRAGVSMFRDDSAYIGIHRDGNSFKLVYADEVRVAPTSLPVGWLNGRPIALDWTCISNGVVRTSEPLTEDQVWLRITADMRAAHVEGYEEVSRTALFEYSFDGKEFIQLGPLYHLTKSTAGYTGYRFGVFNFATLALGGRLRVNYCDLEIWDPSCR